MSNKASKGFSQLENIQIIFPPLLPTNIFLSIFIRYLFLALTSCFHINKYKN